MDEDDLELLLALNGLSYEFSDRAIVEFKVRRVEITPERPHGIGYALVLRPLDGGEPWLRFDNAHGVDPAGGRYVRGARTYDHWHRNANEAGRPYIFVGAAQLLDD